MKKQTKQEKIEMWLSIRTKYENGSPMCDISEVTEGLVGRQSVYRKAKKDGWVDPHVKVKAKPFKKKEIPRKEPLNPKKPVEGEVLKHAGGRPTRPIDYELLDKLCMIHCTGPEICSILEIDFDVLNRSLKREQGVSFKDYYLRKSSGGKASLRRKQIEVAMGGNTQMLIWMGKQHLQQAEKQESVQELVVSNIMPVPVADSVDDWEQVAKVQQDGMLNNDD